MDTTIDYSRIYQSNRNNGFGFTEPFKVIRQCTRTVVYFAGGTLEFLNHDLDEWVNTLEKTGDVPEKFSNNLGDFYINTIDYPTLAKKMALLSFQSDQNKIAFNPNEDPDPLLSPISGLEHCRIIERQMKYGSTEYNGWGFCEPFRREIYKGMVNIYYSDVNLTIEHSQLVYWLKIATITNEVPLDFKLFLYGRDFWVNTEYRDENLAYIMTLEMFTNGWDYGALSESKPYFRSGVNERTSINLYINQGESK